MFLVVATLYIHIPFCKSRCSYCDFYSGIQLSLMERLVDALCLEIALRADYLKGETVETIYFGGGTPSLLTHEHFTRLFQSIQSQFDINDSKEITLEANPDDLSDDYLEMLSLLPFNRISIGLQSLDDTELSLLRRRHSASQAIDAVRKSQRYFSNVSIDLMYGLPAQTIFTWEHTISAALALNVQHVSAYHLTYENGTLLERKRREGKVVPVSEETSVEMFRILCDRLLEKGIEQYEISNFSLSGYRSKHNSSYWHGVNYLGIGPSAHSFDGDSRQWNVADIVSYVEGIEKNRMSLEKEQLTTIDKYNECIMTLLRTVEGISLDFVEQKFGSNRKVFLLRQAARFIHTNLLCNVNGFLKFTPDGFFVSDGIITDLMAD